MAEQENRIRIRFTNPVFIDIFGRYASNHELAGIVAEDGSADLDFVLQEGAPQPPKSCEQVLSLLYALLETDTQSAVGRIYRDNQLNILRESMYRLSEMLEGFSDVRLTMDITAPDKNDPGKKVTSHTEFTLTRTKTSHTDRG
jgi:hypothetical protein